MEVDFQKMGLVLEGGGMRGVFTCGVLDYMLDYNIEFPYAVGVSAGACNGLSYLSRQRGRAKYSNIDLLDKYHYIGLKHLWYQHSILDQRLLYEIFPKKFFLTITILISTTPHGLRWLPPTVLQGGRVIWKKNTIKCVCLPSPKHRAVCPTFVLLRMSTVGRCWTEVSSTRFP